MKMNEPTLHKPVLLNTKVLIPTYYHQEEDRKSGVVVGIASIHVIFSYIVLLDEPLETIFGQMRTVVVNGPELEAPDGSNWKLLNKPEVSA